ncbi:MAG: imidazole glycerol phosphate synthase subunit HisH [Saprospiraceae bacterium]
MKIVIVKYNAGNTQSVLNAFERLGYDARLSDDPAEISGADRVIFPGVGEASSAMAYLRQRGLDSVIRQLTQPVLGICLGMQLLGDFSEENATECLGVIPGNVGKIPAATASGERLKVPHTGWNTVETNGHPLFRGIPGGSFFYFVHSYAMAPGGHTIGRTEYGRPFASAIHRQNFYGVQFHPEKSAGVGEQLLKNFINIIQ